MTKLAKNKRTVAAIIDMELFEKFEEFIAKKKFKNPRKTVTITTEITEAITRYINDDETKEVRQEIETFVNKNLKFNKCDFKGFGEEF